MWSSDVTNLAELLKPPKDGSDSEDEEMSAAAKMTPASVGPPKKEETTENKPVKKPETKDIWEVEDVEEGTAFEDIHDTRPVPEYDIVYKQAVTSEDMFLQMGNKTPATSSCEDMIVKIKLPDTKMADVKLDVRDKFVDCRSHKYKLGLHLPHPVDSKNGRAQWDSVKETLTLTLRMTREYDFMNL